MAIPGFYWLIEDGLAGCSRPGGRRARGAASGPAPSDDLAAISAALDADLAWLRRQGIGAVLSLTETPLLPGALARHCLAELHLPVDDLQAPTPDQFDGALEFIDLQRSIGRSVAVHCLVGQGRTGTILAAYLIRGGA
ncbi:MAG TPA: dual specificity protein phosphatase family protein, partial [Dehalococcoidia bacterium]|nr:dual specificity protein phosphatase family protein [Dehalococcoidia bacterium]